MQAIAVRIPSVKLMLGRIGVQQPLPSFTFGLDVIVLLGHLRLGKHQTLDEAHSEIKERLALLGVSISRREVLYLFDAFCTLLRTASDAKQDEEWLTQVKKNRGIIVSIDGIQLDKEGCN